MHTNHAHSLAREGLTASKHRYQPSPFQVCCQGVPYGGWVFLDSGPCCVDPVWMLLLGQPLGDEAFGLGRQHREHSELPGFVH